MAIRDQRHANLSKQTTLLDGVDVGQPKWRVFGCGLDRLVHEGKCKGSFKDSQWTCKYLMIFRCRMILTGATEGEQSILITDKLMILF